MKNIIKILSFLMFFICIGTQISYADDLASNGISVEIPAGFKVDESHHNIFTLFYREDGTKIHIYNQDVSKDGVESYINYSNKQIQEGKGTVSLTQKNIRTLPNKRKAYEFSYMRPYLTNIQNDQNYYYESNVVFKNEKRVVTIWAKTTEAHKDEIKQAVDKMAQNIILIPEIKNTYSPGIASKDVNIKGKDISITIPQGSMMWGMYHPHRIGEYNYLSNINPIETQLNHKFEFLMTYSDFNKKIDPEDVKQIYADNRIMMFTMQPWLNGDRDSNIILPQIIQGDYDSYIRNWAQSLKAVENPVFVRFANEMNGDWDPWCAWFFAKDTDLYKEAFKRVKLIFEEEGAYNALFVWNPHDRSYPDYKWNNPHLYYPGGEFVDWVGLTGYNNGTSFEGDVWREFSNIYFPLYNEYMEYYGDKPFMITEFSCNEVGGNKENWIRNGFTNFAAMPNIKMAVWFDKVDMLWQYPIDSSQGSLNAFRESLQNPYFIKNGINRNNQEKVQP